MAAIVVLVLMAGGVAYAAQVARNRGTETAKTPERVKQVVPEASKQVIKPLSPPKTIRGVHVTMALASIPGKLDEYLSLSGLNTIQLDVKDENGEIGFVPSAVPLARSIGAAKPYYKPRAVAKQIHAKGMYLIGRVVVMEDPVLSAKRPDLAIHNANGGVWTNHAGLGWSNPYDQRVWEYNVDIAEAAARVGFDEIQFDYVRFPSDGDMSAIVYPGKTSTPPGWVIAQFAQYASKRLKPLGVKVSADVFGLSATRDLGIGQIPKRLGRYLDAIYPMVYPSHFGPGEYNLDDPNGEPGRDGRLRAPGLQPAARRAEGGPDRALAPGLLLGGPDLRPGRAPGSDRLGAPGQGRGLPALERRRDLHPRRGRKGPLGRQLAAIHVFSA